MSTLNNNIDPHSLSTNNKFNFKKTINLKKLNKYGTNPCPSIK